MLRRLSFLLLISLAIHGCSSHQTKNLPPEDQARLSLDSFVLQGKLGVKAPSESGSANIRWQQLPGEFEIHLTGPLGAKRTLISGNAQGVQLTQGDQTLRATTAEELIYKATGWHFPVTQLTYWIRALPAPLAPIEQEVRDTQGLLIELQQLGWHIAYSNYNAQNLGTPTAITPLSMPNRIVATREGYRITLVVREWALGTSN